MFAVILTYKQPMPVVEAHTTAHRAYLDRYYQQGVFLISGRQNPPQGGVILAKADSREHLLRILAEDPFHTENVAEYAIYEFTPTKFQPCLAEWLDGQA
jgi:uncharacterized protein YciI